MRTLMGFERAIVAISWVGWLVYWIAAARRTALTRRMESLLTGASYRVPLLVGICLLVFSGRPLLGFDLRLLPQTSLVAAIGAALTMAGVCFAVWARFHLGKYWSGRITLKEDHRLVQTGPYAWVRHPIYSGILLALLGTTLTVGTLLACVGFAMIFLSFWRKLTIEEIWLRSHLGAQYEVYQKRVKALIPHP